MKALLVTSFEDYFVEQHTLPALTARGVEVVARFEAREVESYDLDYYRANGVEVILHMHEVGGHDSSKKLTERAKLAGLPVRALSRKKASWDFLPPPLQPEPADQPESDPPSSKDDASPIEIDVKPLPLDGGVLLRAELFDWDDAPDEVVQHFEKTRFDRKTARLRDVIGLVIAHGITDYKRVLYAVTEGRRTGVFPRLCRLKAEALPKLVETMLENELEVLRKEDAAGVTTLRHIQLYEGDRKELERLGLEAHEGPRTVNLPPKKEPNVVNEPQTPPPSLHPSSKLALLRLGRQLQRFAQHPDPELLRMLKTASDAGLTLEELIVALEEP